MNHRKSLLAGLLGLSLLAPLAEAASELIDASNPERLQAIFSGFGFAELGKDDKGDPVINGRIQGSKYVAYFYDCKDGRNCGSLQITSGWSGVSVPLEQINAWNRDKRFCKAYLDGEGDPMLEMDINLRNSVNRRNLEDTMEYWQICLREFQREALNQR